MSAVRRPSFHEFRKQASFFLKEKIKSARLVLTDVTPIQLLTEDSVRGDQSAPDTQSLGRISKAAFEVDEYWRIVDILHDRLSTFERKNWRVTYNCLIVLEHLLTHGPESVADEFMHEHDKQVISQASNFQCIDEKGFNWGLTVRKKSERVLKLLEKGPLLKEERERSRKLTRGIQGFGSFSSTSRAAATSQGILNEPSLPCYARSNSQFNPTNQFSEEAEIFHDTEKGLETPLPGDCLVDSKSTSAASLKENVEPCKEQEQNGGIEERHQWNCLEPSRPLLEGKKGGNKFNELEDHPFSDDTCASSLL
ncbi:hypothetical protein SAY87_005281 [Trapa incisa]|uniref:ENTH domain-containing protein n=1 Tax=Trapa incisa TaxID=236973 RepID=A0AAN7K9K1_9MYRT|nr:hypothetical protein SAY87_005281 [Trapa incisa]